MDEELKKIRRSLNVLPAKVAFQREAAEKVEEAVGDLSHDFDALDAVQSSNEKRFKRIEKHIGL